MRRASAAGRTGATIPEEVWKVRNPRFYSYWVPGLVELIFPGWS
jgi:hypothetical protein